MPENQLVDYLRLPFVGKFIPPFLRMNSRFSPQPILAFRFLTALLITTFYGLPMTAADPFFDPVFERKTHALTDSKTHALTDSKPHALDSIDPILLKITVLSDFNGFNVSCHDSHDGFAKLEVTNAILPLEIYWSTGEIIPNPKLLESGWNGVSITDAAGVRAVDSVFLTAPASLQIDLEVAGEKCLNAANGSLKISSATGGVQPFLFSLNDSPASQQLEFSPLAAGHFFLKMEDANGCQDTFGLVVPAGLPFDFELGIDTASIRSGDSLRLPLAVLGSVDTIIWSPSAAFSGLNEAVFSPLKTTFYRATAVDSAGCQAHDDFLLTVKKQRDFFFPNAIRRSSTAIENRFFTLFTSDGVAEIESLDVFDRWGNLVFSRKNFPASQPELGWNGFFQGKPVMLGVFTAQVIIRQTDGQTKLYLETVTVFD